MKTTTPLLSLDEVERAQRRLAGGVRRTPCHLAPIFAGAGHMRVWLKRDDLQRTGSFKERGARNALLSLSDTERARGVVAASAGNHALGLAFHGGTLGVKVTVVMPVGASELKVARCRGLGAEVVLRGENFERAQAHALEIAARTGATPVHPFDDLRVIAGQGTQALEIVEQVADFDTIVVPVGGGGLLAGTATVVKALRPRLSVVAVEPEHAAGFLAACLNGRPCTAPVVPTLADGLAVSRIGEATFAIAAPLIDDVVTVSESEIAAAVAWLAREAGVVAEGAGATAMAAVLAGKVSGRSVVLPVTGRNVDARVHAQVVTTGDSSREERTKLAVAA